MNAAKPARRYDIDALRVLAFAALILYHIGMYYVPEWGWHIKSAHSYEWLQLPMVWMNQWRMSLLFLIAGLATWFMLQHRSGRQTALRRLKVLGLPIVAGMLVVVVPQAYFEARANGVVAPGYLAFWRDYLLLKPWPEDAFAGSDPGWTWMHLWFLPYLLVYSLLLIAVRNLSVLQRLGTAFGRLKGWALIVVPVLPLIVGAWSLREWFPRTHDLVNDWYLHTMYGTLFLYGYWLANADGVWAELRRLRRRLLISATVVFAAMWTLFELWPDESTLAQRQMIRPLIMFNLWLWLCTILGYAFAYLNRPRTWVASANRAVFAWYVIHQTAIIVVAATLAPYGLNGWLEASAVMVGTIVCCWAFDRLVVRNAGPLAVWLGGSRALISNSSPNNLDRRSAIDVR